MWKFPSVWKKQRHMQVFSVNLNFLKRYKETRNSRKKTWARTSHRWWKGLELGAVFLEAQEYLSGGTLAAPPTRLTSSLVPHLSFLLLLMVSLFFSAPPGFFFLTTCASCSLCILASLPLCFLQASVYVCVQTPWEDLLGSPYPIKGTHHWSEPRARPPRLSMALYGAYSESLTQSSMSLAVGIYHTNMVSWCKKMFHASLYRKEETVVGASTQSMKIGQIMNIFPGENLQMYYLPSICCGLTWFLKSYEWMLHSEVFSQFT